MAGVEHEHMTGAGPERRQHGHGRAMVVDQAFDPRLGRRQGHHVLRPPHRSRLLDGHGVGARAGLEGDDRPHVRPSILASSSRFNSSGWYPSITASTDAVSNRASADRAAENARDADW